MESSVRLAKGNIKITGIQRIEEDYYVTFEYQWRDKNHNARWSADFTIVPTHGEWGNGPDRDTTDDDIRVWVRTEVETLRMELED